MTTWWTWRLVSLCLLVTYVSPEDTDGQKELADAHTLKIMTQAARNGESIANTMQKNINEEKTAIKNAEDVEADAVALLLKSHATGRRKITLETEPGFDGKTEFKPAGFEITSTNTNDKPQDEPASQTTPNTAFQYPLGLGPALFGGCMAMDYNPQSPCAFSKKIASKSQLCLFPLDATNYVGVGFDGRGLYSAESRKQDIIQRKCTAGSMFMKKEVPDIMNCYGIYDINVHSQVFDSAENYMDYIRDKARVSNTKTLFTSEKEKISHSKTNCAWFKCETTTTVKVKEKQTFTSNTKTDSTDESRQNNKASSNFMALMEVNIVMYEIALDEVTPTDLNFNLLKEYVDLPSSHLAPGAEQKYQDFILRWGTHLIRSVKIGGQLKITKTVKGDKTMTKTDFAKTAETEFQAMFSNLDEKSRQQNTFVGIFGLGKHDNSGQANAGQTIHSSSESTYNYNREVKQAAKESKFTQTNVEANGGEPGIALAVVDFYTPSFKDTYSSWIRSIHTYPKPIEFTLKGLDEILNFNVDSLFPNGMDFKNGCSGKEPGITIMNEFGTKRRFYYTDSIRFVNNSTITEKTKVYCKYSSLGDFKEAFSRKHLALERAIAIYLAEGKVPTNNFEVKGGAPGCEANTLSAYKDHAAIPTWSDMKTKQFNIIFDLPADVPTISKKNQQYTMTYMYNKWFTTQPHKEVLHMYGGCSIFHEDTKDHRLCVNNLAMTYDEKTGLFTVTPEDFKISNATIENLPSWLNGATVARGQVMSLQQITKGKNLEGKSLAVPCSMKFRNSYRITEDVKDTCLHFAAATAGDIFVIFASVPNQVDTWYYIHINNEGVNYYKGLQVVKSDYKSHLGTLGDKTLFTNFFVCFLKYPNGQIGIHYGKDNSYGAKFDSTVLSAYTYQGIAAKNLRLFYTFGAGTDTITIHNLHFTTNMPAMKCPDETYALINGRCEINCDPECKGCSHSKTNKRCFECRHVRIINPDNKELTCVSKCPGGYGPDSKDSNLCSMCAPGTYKSTESNSACEPCPAGSATDKSGQTSCSPCSLGEYQPKTGQTSCIKASVDHYVDSTGQTQQKQCSTINPIKPSTVYQKGSTSASDCHEQVELIGCFNDNNARAMKELHEITNMTRGMCLKKCREKGYDFFGVQGGSWCSCDDTKLENRKFGMYGKEPMSSCSYKCRGDESLTCGGDMKNEVYGIRNFKRMYYIGCFKDSNPRAISGVQPQLLTGLTIEICFKYCHEKGYEYFGLQGNSYCSCGDGAGYAKYGVEPQSSCNLKCTGNQDQTCGGSWVNEVYGIHRHLYRYQGCYGDNTATRDMKHSYNAGNLVSKQYCHYYCQSKHYEFFGMQNANTCFCGNTLGAYGKKSDSECNSNCPTNAALKCGGSATTSAYSVIGNKHMLIGCYQDSATSRDMTDFESLGSRLTIESCYEHCLAKSKKFFGVQEGKICACDDKYGKHGVRNMQECHAKTCQGNDQQYCGGSLKTLVYMILY